MNRENTRASLCLLLCLLVSMAQRPICASTQDQLPPVVTDYVIGPQDVLTIAVYGQPDLTGRYTVETDGMVSFPLIGRVKAAGLKLLEFNDVLAKELADGFFKNPQISVGVEQYRSQRIFVIGEVRSPGPYPLTGGMSLIEALARAGANMTGEAVIVRPSEAKGPTLPGQDKNAQVHHIDLKDLQTGATADNLDLRDGDTVFIPRAESVYVFGQVKSPGAYGIPKNTTVLQALSMAGGVTENGAMNRITIVRMVNGKKAELKAKLDDPVNPGDTIIVPERYF